MMVSPCMQVLDGITSMPIFVGKFYQYWRLFYRLLKNYRFVSISHPRKPPNLHNESRVKAFPSFTDKSAPIVEFCPRDVFYEVKTTDKVRITWPEPRFKDNIGIKQITKSVPNGGMHSPTTFNVIYDAYDHAGNIATCIFQVRINSELTFLTV